ncbi:MAG: hypothetical protein Q8831_02335 ['Bonamia sp.' little leaf phytoplasma]|nr:hypothetical protein ['Bonamia sp.' little leaf phytoplasma]
MTLKILFLTLKAYFNLEIKNNGGFYDNTKRFCQWFLNSEDVGYLDIQIQVKQKQFINQKDPRLNLILDYELVDLFWFQKGS